MSKSKTPTPSPAFAGEYIYVWMVRHRPRRKADPPGPWRPRGSVLPSLEHLKTCAAAHNDRDRKEEHAVFRAPATALEMIYPEPVYDRMVIAYYLRDGRAASRYAKNLSAAARAAGLTPSRLHRFERASAQGADEEYSALCDLYGIARGPTAPGRFAGAGSEVQA